VEVAETAIHGSAICSDTATSAGLRTAAFPPSYSGTLIARDRRCVLSSCGDVVVYRALRLTLVQKPRSIARFHTMLRQL